MSPTKLNSIEFHEGHQMHERTQLVHNSNPSRTWTATVNHVSDRPDEELPKLSGHGHSAQPEEESSATQLEHSRKSWTATVNHVSDRPDEELPKLSGHGHSAQPEESSATQLEHSRKCNSRTKLVVNSHVKYAKVVSTLVQSLEKVGFTRWSDVVVFRGGAEQDGQPQPTARGLVFVDMKINSYDFNALSGLYHHRDSPHVCAGAYLYILDTVVAGVRFPGAFDRLRLEPGEQLMSPRPNSNIMAFDHILVERYGTNFDREITKQEGIYMECGLKTVEGIHELEHFATKVTMAADRIEQEGLEDIYNTGYPRKKFYYPEFGLYKYILHQMMGNITDDHVERIFPR